MGGMIRGDDQRECSSSFTADGRAWICAFRMGDKSVKRYSSCRLLGMRIVRSAALHSSRILLSLCHPARC